jgi:hypothetical protein
MCFCLKVSPLLSVGKVEDLTALYCFRNIPIGIFFNLDISSYAGTEKEASVKLI